MSQATEQMAASTPTPRKRRKATSFDANPAKAGWLTKLVLVLLCLVWMIPVIGTVITSFRTVDDSNSSGWWTVFGSLDNLTLSNYNEALTGTDDMGNAFWNSLVISCRRPSSPC